MKKKILLIDDEEDLTEMLSYRLMAAGYDIDIANDGATGVKRTKEYKPDIIILDLMMPEMSGYEVADELRKDQELSSIPFIVFTAAVNKELEERVNHMGAADYITKPFEPEDLIEKINNL